MPTLHRSGALRVVIYPNDHPPAHIHVMNREKEAVFQLNCPDGPPALRESFGFALRELRPILDMLATMLPALCHSWDSIHGIE